jgi:hypothetical protein
MLLKLLDGPWALLKGIAKPLGNPQILLDSLLAILKGYWKDTEKCPNTHCQSIGEKDELPSNYQQKHGNVHEFYLQRCIYV